MALTLFVLAAVICPKDGWAQTLRVFFGDPAHPVVSGEAWLIANRWGAYPGVLVATIRNGKLQTRPLVQFPQYWEQASDYKLLLAVADQPVGPPASMVEDDAYGFQGRPEYLKLFSTIYLSPPLPAKQLGKNWLDALRQIGELNSDELVLPLPVRRTIRLLYPDGRPLENARVPVLLFGSRYNHCGADVGIDLGTYTTSREGGISVIAPRASLDLSMFYYEVEAGGPAGETFTLEPFLIIGSEPAITVKKLWTLPQHDYVVSLRTAENQPIAHAHLTAYMNFEGCGGWTPIHAPESDASGTIRFRYEDLREMNSLTVVSSDGKRRNLTDSEMRELLTTYHLNLRWD